MSSHFIRRCECGIIIAQCKCYGIKSETVVRGCTHVTASNKVTEPITLASLTEFYTNAPRIPNVLRVSPEVYESIRLYFMELEKDDMLRTNAGQLPHTSFLGSVMGVQVLIDKDYAPNEWRFEYNEAH